MNHNAVNDSALTSIGYHYRYPSAVNTCFLNEETSKLDRAYAIPSSTISPSYSTLKSNLAFTKIGPSLTSIVLLSKLIKHHTYVFFSLVMVVVLQLILKINDRVSDFILILVGEVER